MSDVLVEHGIGAGLPIKSTTPITITPNTVDQILVAGQYLKSITIKGDVNLVASNILKNKSIFGVTGTLPPRLNIIGLAPDLTDYGFTSGFTKDYLFAVQQTSNNAVMAWTKYNRNGTIALTYSYKGVLNANWICRQYDINGVFLVDQANMTLWYMYNENGSLLRTVTLPDNLTYFVTYYGGYYYLVDSSKILKRYDSSGTFIKNITPAAISFYAEPYRYVSNTGDTLVSSPSAPVNMTTIKLDTEVITTGFGNGYLKSQVVLAMVADNNVN